MSQVLSTPENIHGSEHVQGQADFVDLNPVSQWQGRSLPLVMPLGFQPQLRWQTAPTLNWEKWEVTARVTVVPEGATIQNSAQKTEDASANAGVKALTSTCPASREELMQWVDSQNKPFPQEGYSIQVNNVTIGTVPDRQAADEIAAQMRQAIVQVEEHPAELRPHINSSMAGAMVKDQKVFELTDDVMPVQSATMAEVATAWVNNLRHVFGAPTLDLGKTQMVAQELGETDQVIGGTASWYGPYFHGRLTATGEIFDQHALTAAHKTLPFGTVLKVRNLLNDKTVVVRINDRGPYIGNRSLDLSYAAAQCLDSEIVGVIPYEATILAPGVPEAWQADGELTAEK